MQEYLCNKYDLSTTELI